VGYASVALDSPFTGGMLTSTNRIFNEKDLDFLAKEAFTGGIDLLHHWKDKEFYLDAKLLGSYVGGSTEAVRTLQESSAHYYQRPGAEYLSYDTSRTNLSGFGGKIKVGKGSKGQWKYSADLSWLSPGLELNDLGYMNSADEIKETNEVTYLVTRPVSVFNTLQVDLEQFNSWNFGGTWLGSGGHLSFESTFRNNWSLRTNLIFHSQADDPRKLRGGPDMIMPHSLLMSGNIMSDPSKKLLFLISSGFEGSGNNSARSFEVNPSVSIRPFSALRLRLTVNYQNNLDELQYVATRDYNGEKRYILGTIDQTTLGLTLRADLNLTPEFSIQYYGSPFVSQGAYSEYKRITEPGANEYGQRFTLFDPPVFDSGNIAGLDENNDSSPDYYIMNPDFTFFQYRSNLVAKWEYRLGSFIYLVWSSDRTGSSYLSDASLGESYRDLWQVHPGNIFLIKLSYWFSL